MSENRATDDSVQQHGDGPKIYIRLPDGSMEKFAALVHRQGIMLGLTAAALLLAALLFLRYISEAEMQTYQFNLLRSCLQSAQCDVKKVLEQLK